MVTRGMDQDGSQDHIYKGSDVCVQKKNLMFLQNIGLIGEH